MPENNIQRISCEGWWEQEYFGRQAMTELVLQFEDGVIIGSGTDVIGRFAFTGAISAAGQVALLKQYLGQHSVDYIGTYDGEGVMWGEWRIGSWHDRWLIRLRRGGSTGKRLWDEQTLA